MIEYEVVAFDHCVECDKKTSLNLEGLCERCFELINSPVAQDYYEDWKDQDGQQSRKRIG